MGKIHISMLLHRCLWGRWSRSREAAFPLWAAFL